MTPETDIRDIKGLAAIPLLPWWAWCLLIGALLTVAIVAWWLWRRRRKPSTHPVSADADLSPYDLARRALEELHGSGLLTAGTAAPLYIRLSDIVRHYLEGRFFLRAPERTTEEFLQDAANRSNLTAEQRAMLASFLAESDLVKFARLQPSSGDRQRAFEAAQAFVEQTRPVEQPPKPSREATNT